MPTIKKPKIKAAKQTTPKLKVVAQGGKVSDPGYFKKNPLKPKKIG